MGDMDGKRDQSIHVRLNDRERQLIERAADHNGVSVPVVFRSLLRKWLGLSAPELQAAETLE